MSVDDRRSEQVIAAYKRHKLSRNALYRIGQLLQGFECERAFDRHLAWYGVAIIVALLAFAALSRLRAEQLVL